LLVELVGEKEGRGGAKKWVDDGTGSWGLGDFLGSVLGDAEAWECLQ
jgi:hypothetical protein